MLKKEMMPCWVTACDICGRGTVSDEIVKFEFVTISGFGDGRFDYCVSCFNNTVNPVLQKLNNKKNETI